MARRTVLIHPLPIRLTHWVSAAAIFIMVGSGWRIYDWGDPRGRGPSSANNWFSGS